MLTTSHEVSKNIRQDTKLQKKLVVSQFTVLKTWQITNSTDASLVIIDAFLSDPASTNEFYQRSLQLLSTTDGLRFIKSGETKTIALDEVHTGTDGNAMDYTIIIARADNLFPVKIFELSVSQDSFSDTTVTTDDVKLLRQAEAFQQTILAFPTSNRTTAWANVLKNPDEQKVQAFFQSNPEYAALNLEIVTAVQTYYSRYCFAWAGYAATKLYYLYTSDGTIKKYVGSVTINNKTVAPITNLDVPDGFTVTYTDFNHRNTKLYYSNGQFSENVVSSAPAICLSGLFMLKSSITGNSSDNTLTAVLFGILNKTEVFGYEQKDSTNPDESLFSPQSLKGRLVLSGMLVSALFALGALAVGGYYIFKFVKKALQPPLTPEQIERLNTDKVTKILERMVDAGVRVPEDLTRSLADIKAEANKNLLADNREKIDRILQKQYKESVVMLEYGSTSALQSAFETIEWDRSRIKYIVDPKDMAEQIDSFRQNITKNAKVLAGRSSSISKKLTLSETQIISDAKAIADSSVRGVDTNEDIRKDLDNDEVPELIEE